MITPRYRVTTTVLPAVGDVKQAVINLNNSLQTVDPNRNRNTRIEQFVIDHGREFKNVRRAQRMGTMKACFQNSTGLVLRHDGLLYAEGYVARETFPFPIHHAWVVDEMDPDTAIDPTLRDVTNLSYLGVLFTREEMSAEVFRNGFYGLLDTPTGLNIRFMNRIREERTANAKAE